MAIELSDPISIRFPVALLEAVQNEAERDFVSVSAVIRRCVAKELGFAFVSENSSAAVVSTEAVEKST